MRQGVVATGIVAHLPTLATKRNTPIFQRNLVRGQIRMGQSVAELEIDIFIIISTHWVSTFNWIINYHQIHSGVCVANEDPQLIPGIPYKYSGDPVFAKTLEKYFRMKNIPTTPNNSPYFNWDYGTLVPLLHLDPSGKIPVLNLPVVLTANLAECELAGNIIEDVSRKIKKRVGVIASSALSHELVRGRQQKPKNKNQEIDMRFTKLLLEGRVAEAKSFFHEFVTKANFEMGGRAIATMLGASSSFHKNNVSATGTMFGNYTQSSGSGNINLLIT